MQGDTLLLASDPAQSYISIRFEGNESSAKVRLPGSAGFGLGESTAALMATGWVVSNEGALKMATDHSCRYLAQVVSAMLDLFESPNEPGNELLQVQSAVAEYYDVQSAGIEPSLYDCAWMNVMLREAIVEEARCLEHIWSDTVAVVIPVSHYRDSLVKLLLARITGQNSAVVGKMAASQSTRTVKSDMSKSG